MVADFPSGMTTLVVRDRARDCEPVLEEAGLVPRDVGVEDPAVSDLGFYEKHG